MKVGVIGAGYWGQKHIAEYQAMGADLVGIADPVPGQLRQHKGLLTTTHVDELLDEVDAVSICVPNEHHAGVAFQALRAGKHVLVEKPMTMSEATSYELVDEAHKRGLTLAVGHVFRFNNAINELRARNQRSEFGDLYTLIARWTTHCPPFEGRGVIMDLAPHAFDIMNHVLDEWPTRITCRGGAFRRPDLEETAFITAEFPSGALGQIEASWILPGKVRSIEAVGSKRAAHIEALDQRMTIHDEAGAFDAGVKANNTIQDELRAFLDAASNGSTSVNSGLIGAHVVRCVKAAERSMQVGHTIELEWDE